MDCSEATRPSAAARKNHTILAQLGAGRGRQAGGQTKPAMSNTTLLTFVLAEEGQGGLSHRDRGIAVNGNYGLSICLDAGVGLSIPVRQNDALVGVIICGGQHEYPL